jgi:hypothetical protein
MRRIDLAELTRKEPAITDRHALKVHCSRGDDAPVEIATGNPEQYPFSLPQAPAEFRIELG